MNVERAPSDQSRQAGFTLMEVLVVIAIIAVTAAIAIPGIMNWLPNYKLKGAARDVYSAMQKARSIAVKSNRSAAIVFIPATNEYQLCDAWVSDACEGNEETFSLDIFGNGIKFGHGNATAPVAGSGNPFPANNIGYTDNRVVFNSRGFGDEGNVYLDHQENTTTYAIGSSNSGSIRILKWQGGDWQ